MKTINLIGDVGWDITNELLMAQLPVDKSEPVHIFIDSYGGIAFEGFSIFNTLDKRSNVIVEIGAMAFSAASYWPFAADGGVIVNKNSSWMAHNASGFACGDRHDMQKELVLLEGLDNIIADTYTDKLGMTKKQVMSRMDDEFWLFGGQAIIDAGIAAEMREGPDAGDDMPDSSEIVQNFRAIFNEKMSHKPSQPTDYNLFNFMIKDFTQRKENEVKTQNLIQTVTPTAAVIPAAATPAAPAQAPAVQNVTEVGNVVPTVTPVAPVVVDNSQEIANAVSAERKRIMNLLELSGTKLNELATNAINTDMDAGTFAIAQLKAKNAEPVVPETPETSVTPGAPVNPAAGNAGVVNIGAAPSAKDMADSIAAQDKATKESKCIEQGNSFYEASLKK